MNSWNPVLNKFVEIKQAFTEKFGQNELFSYEKEKETCLDYWIRRLENKRYAAMFSPLKLTEYKNFLQIRYRNYDIYKKDPYSEEQDFWKRYDGFYNECRSVVLDIKRDCLVLTPFRKFRNLNESEEYSLEAIKARIAKAKTVEVTEKLDGSLQFARYYHGEVVMAGSHSLDCKTSWRLADGYSMLNEKYQKMLRDYAEHTFLFEYVSMKDKHVVSYKKEQEGLYLVGIRETETGWEWPYQEVIELAKKYEIPVPEMSELTFEQVLSGLNEKKAEEAEGYVLNIDGFKVKIKFDDFVSAHHAVKDLTAVNSLIQSIAENTYDDLFAKVASNYKEQVQKNAQLVFRYIEVKQKKINQYVMEGPKADRKEFMLWVAKEVPAELQFYVRSAYKQEPYHVLYAANGRCVKFSEIVSYLEEIGENA